MTARPIVAVWPGGVAARGFSGLWGAGRVAQTMWDIRRGLEVWNEKIVKGPGPYARAPGWSMPPGPPPLPEIVWPDQEPVPLDGPLQERLDHWMTLVHRGNVLEAY